MASSPGPITVTFGHGSSGFKLRNLRPGLGPEGKQEGREEPACFAPESVRPNHPGQCIAESASFNHSGRVRRVTVAEHIYCTYFSWAQRRIWEQSSRQAIRVEYAFKAGEVPVCTWTDQDWKDI